MFVFVWAYLALFAAAPSVALKGSPQPTFEGKIVQHYHRKGAATMQITWYIKGDRIAFDMVALEAKKDEPVFRFVPDASGKVLKMRQLNGSFTMDIAADAIQLVGDADKISEAKETGRGNIEPRFTQMVDVQASSPTLKIDIEYTPDIAIDWQPIQALFKSDYAIGAMVRLSAKGFPYASKGVDASGEVVFECVLKQVQQEKIADSVFK